MNLYADLYNSLNSEYFVFVEVIEPNSRMPDLNTEAIASCLVDFFSNIKLNLKRRYSVRQAHGIVRSYV